jgi:hypothetical protein
MAPQQTSAQFGVSAYLATLHSPASTDAVLAQLIKLLAILGENDPSLAAELAAAPVNLRVLSDLVLWNQRLATNPVRDRIGQAATLFWAAQTLVTTVMRSSALDRSAKYSSGVERAIRRGADGLFEFGKSQFEALGFLTVDVIDWLVAHKAGSVAFIESPIGNTVPVQLLSDLTSTRGLPSSVVVWNAPRNDRRSRGRTVKDAAKECAVTVKDFDYVVLLDEVLSGSRYGKLLSALRPHIAPEKFLAIAMLFDDTSRPALKASPTRQQLIEKLETQGKKIGFKHPVRAFPLLRLFKLDAGNQCKWETPVIWGDSDLIAGKRKVNLIFMILDHCLGVLQDLSKDKSEFRPHLIRAWSQITQGQAFAFKTGVIQQLFRGIVTRLPFNAFRDLLWEMAKRRFPSEYVGDVAALVTAGAEERWLWLREAFVTEASKRIGEQDAWTAWNAIDTTFAASFQERKPKAQRDLDATPYTLPFNDTICAFNRRLRDLLMKVALKHGGGAASR